MNEIGKFSEKGKEEVTSPVKTRDFTRPHQEKLTLDPQRDILKGGISGETSKKQGETSKQQVGPQYLQVSSIKAQMTTPGGSEAIESEKRSLQTLTTKYRDERSPEEQELFSKRINKIIEAEQQYTRDSTHLRKNYR